ncbi:MAG: transporter related protein [Conexibacter sp.]|nr:transporter related protein [Conexibacter sp.]
MGRGEVTPAERADPALRASGVVKDFAGTRALDGVSFDVAPGEIHALVGSNGSGKSTLVKILAGVETADAGELELGRQRHDLRHFSTALARREGLHFVHQQPTTFGDLTVAENLATSRGYETGPLGGIRWRALRRRVAGVLRRFEIDAGPDDVLDTLSPSTQTMVAIARALQDQEDERGGVLVLDEPTAALSASEAERVLDAIRRFAAQGQAIVFISHRLEEIVRVADRITVLRDGRLVTTVERHAVDHDGLVELIVGRPLDRTATAALAPSFGAAVLQVRELGGGRVHDVDASIAAGEVVGLAGLTGSGRSTLLRLLFGAQQRTRGSIEVDGVPLAPRRPSDAIDAGVAYVPEDRLGQGVFPGMSVLENLSAGFVADYARHGHVGEARERVAAVEAIERYMIRTPSSLAPITTLSGGNQQKVVLARWLRRNPRVLLLDEPTQGVDVGARAELWHLIQTAALAGAAALVVSSDLEELVQFCGRILLLRDGTVCGDVDVIGSGLDADRLNHLLHAETVAA